MSERKINIQGDSERNLIIAGDGNVVNINPARKQSSKKTQDDSHALLNLDCIEHIDKFTEFVPSHPAAAFVIHGYSKYGLKILIKRILQEIPFTPKISFTPTSPIRIDWTSIQQWFGQFLKSDIFIFI